LQPHKELRTRQTKAGLFQKRRTSLEVKDFI